MASEHTLFTLRFLPGILNISPHEDILRFEGKIPTPLQLRAYIIIFSPESFMTFPFPQMGLLYRSGITCHIGVKSRLAIFFNISSRCETQ
jgi:hypothetical protein